MTHCSRLALVLAMLAPAAASAQFTTFVPAPAARVSDSAHAVVAAVQKARTDSITHTTLTNMKAWVDSAAGSLATTDSAGAPGDSTRAGATVATTTDGRATTTFSNGAVAPETASSLPLLALIGLAALSLGTVLLAGRAPRA